MARNKIDTIINNLGRLKEDSYTEDKIIDAACGALELLKTYRAGKVQDAMHQSAVVSLLLQDAIIAVTSDAMGQDYGPITQKPAFDEFN